MKKMFSALLLTALISAVTATEPVPQVKKVPFSPQLRSKLRIRQGAFDTVGDLYLITAPDGKHTLIDGGLGVHRNKPYYARVLFKILQEQKITRLEQIIITHPHEDHFGSIPYLLRRKDISIGRVCWSYLPPEQIIPKEPKWTGRADQTEIIELCKKRAIKLVELKKGDVIDFGSGITGFIFSTGARSATHNYVNNQSLVFKLKYHDFTMLFTGDCGFFQEDEILKEFGSDLKSTVLKCGHHAGSGSTGEKFLAAVAPELITSSMPKWLSSWPQAKEVETRIRKFGKAAFVRSWEYPQLSIVSDGKGYELMEITYPQ